MTADFSHIESFAQFLSEENRVQTLYLLDPKGEHKYLFSPTRRAVRLLAEVISGEGRKRRLGNYALRGCAYAPPTARLLPLVSQVSVSLSEELSFDVAILSNRTRLLDLDAGRVYAIPRGESAGIVDEIHARERLPPEVHTPTLYETDTDYPYFVEEFVQGRRPRSPVDDWAVLHEGLQQLKHIHDDTSAVVPVEKVVREVEQRLETRELHQEKPFQVAVSLLDELELPESVYRSDIHGDFHARNVLSSDSTAYVLDWERFKSDYVFRDFFKSFAIAYHDTHDASTFAEMIRGEGQGGRIYESYISSCGESMCDPPYQYSGLPLLHLLVDVSRKDRSDLWYSYRELIGKLVDQVPERTRS